MPRRPIDRLVDAADSARPEIGVRAVVVAEQRPRWASFAEGGAFLAVVVAVASTGLAGGPLAVVLTAATAGACAAFVRGRVTRTDLIALGAGRAHLFDAERSLLSVRVGGYRGPVRPDELTFVNGGRVHDEWALLGRTVRVLRVHRHLLDAIAGTAPG